MIEVYTDGRAEPNPGLGTYGFVVYKDGRRLHSEHGVAGHDVTNNYAEYHCLVKALVYLNSLREEKIKVLSDSKLLVYQMKGDWRVKKGAYLEEFLKARDLADGFADLEFDWIPREKNSEADELTNIAFFESRRE